jgi:hypothetical protein
MLTSPAAQQDVQIQAFRGARKLSPRLRALILIGFEHHEVTATFCHHHTTVLDLILSSHSMEM